MPLHTTASPSTLAFHLSIAPSPPGRPLSPISCPPTFRNLPPGECYAVAAALQTFEVGPQGQCFWLVDVPFSYVASLSAQKHS